LEILFVSVDFSLYRSCSFVCKVNHHPWKKLGDKRATPAPPNVFSIVFFKSSLAKPIMYFIRVMLSDQKRFRMLLSCKIRACWKSESLNAICFLRRRKTIINLWPLNHGTVEFYFYPWNKKVLTGIINLATILKQRTEIKFSQNL